jgi:hypothetical protein
VEYLWVIGILVALVILILLFKLIKNIVKTLMSFALIVVVISLVVGAIMFIDTRNFVNGIKNKENIFLLNDDGFVSGFILSEMNKTTSISNRDLGKFDDYYEESKYDHILEDKYKFFIFELDSLTAGKDDQMYVDFLKGIATEFEVEGDYDHITDPKTVAFIALVINNVKDDPLYLVNSYKQGNLTIYPESATFKLIKMIK